VRRGEGEERQESAPHILGGASHVLCPRPADTRGRVGPRDAGAEGDARGDVLCDGAKETLVTRNDARGQEARGAAGGCGPFMRDWGEPKPWLSGETKLRSPLIYWGRLAGEGRDRRAGPGRRRRAGACDGRDSEGRDRRAQGHARSCSLRRACAVPRDHKDVITCTMEATAAALRRIRARPAATRPHAPSACRRRSRYSCDT
jgi:hypothetical protein